MYFSEDKQSQQAAGEVHMLWPQQRVGVAPCGG
jgi:hypothetical protein